MATGTIYNIIEKAAEMKSGGKNVERTKLLLKMRLTTQTGLSMQKYSPTSQDADDEVEKVLKVIRSPIIGLSNFSY